MSAPTTERLIERDGYVFRLPEAIVECGRLGASPSLAQFEDVDRALVVSTYRRAESLPGRLGLEGATGSVVTAFEATGPVSEREEVNDDLMRRVSFTGGSLAESRVTVVALRLADGVVAVLELAHPADVADDTERITEVIVMSLKPTTA